MMSELTRLRDEAERLLTTYAEYKDCNDLVVKTRVHVELDRFLMANRETAALLMLEGLDAEIERLRGELQLDYERKPSVLNKIWRRIRRDDKSQGRRDDKSQGRRDEEPNDKPDTDEWHEDPDQPKYFNQ